MDEERLENLFLLRVGEVFHTFCQWYPAKADGFRGLFHTLLNQTGGLGMDSLLERFHAGKSSATVNLRLDAQGWCDRMSGHVASMAGIVALDYPELGEALLALSHHIGDVMNEYKKRIGDRWAWTGQNDGPATGALLPLPQLTGRAVEAFYESLPLVEAVEDTASVPLPTRALVGG